MQCKICQHEVQLLHNDLFDDRYGYPGLYSVYVCSNCEFAQTIPEPTQEEMATLYTNYYPRKDITVDAVRANSTFRPGFLFTLNCWLKGIRNTCHYHVQPGQRVLDIGCGDGASLLDIQKAGGEAYGTEYDKNVEPIAKELGLQIFFGDVQDAPFQDSFFDVITLSQLLEHISDPIQFITDIQQKLKPGGSIIMAFPNRLGFNGTRSDRTWINWHIPYHVNFFSNTSLQLLAEKTGMEIEYIKTYTPNVWLQLQTLNSAHSAEVGKPSPVWMPLAQASKEDVATQQPVWKRKVRTGLAMLRSYGRIPLTRLQDAMGKGDSYLVVLKKPSTR